MKYLNRLKNNLFEMKNEGVAFVNALKTADEKFTNLDANGRYEKDETLKEAFRYYEENMSGEFAEIFKDYDGSNSSVLEIISKICNNSGTFNVEGMKDVKTLSKLLDYKQCGFDEVISRKESVKVAFDNQKQLITEIGNDVTNNQIVKGIIDTSKSIMNYVYEKAAMYFEEFDEEIDNTKEEPRIEVSEVLDTKVRNAAKFLSKKLDDFASRNQNKGE